MQCRALRSTVLLAAFVLLLVPAGAAAQGGILEVVAEPPADPVMPLSGRVGVPGEVRVACHLLADRGNATRGGVVELAVEAPPGTEALLLASSLDAGFRDDCPEGGRGVPFNASVAFTMAAPALQPQPVNVTAHLLNGTTETAAGTLQFRVTPAYVSVLDVAVEEAIVTATPASVRTLSLVMEEKGNGLSRVALSATGLPDGWLFSAPPTVTLVPGEPQTVRLGVHVPDAAATGADTKLDLRAQAAYAYDPSVEGDAWTGSALVSVKGAGLPGPGAVVALVALALVAALGAGVARRGRDP